MELCYRWTDEVRLNNTNVGEKVFTLNMLATFNMHSALLCDFASYTSGALIVPKHRYLSAHRSKCCGFSQPFVKLRAFSAASSFLSSVSVHCCSIVELNVLLHVSVLLAVFASVLTSRGVARHWISFETHIDFSERTSTPSTTSPSTSSSLAPSLRHLQSLLHQSSPFPCGHWPQVLAKWFLQLEGSGSPASARSSSSFIVLFHGLWIPSSFIKTCLSN